MAIEPAPSLASRQRRIARLRISLLVLASTIAATGPALAQNGSVFGTITNEATSAPVSSAQAIFCPEAGGGCLGSSVTTASGVYSASLPAGTYFAYTSTGGGLVNEVFGDFPCPGPCNPALAHSHGTPIVVASNTSLTRNFALAPGGSISGAVTSAAGGAAVPGVQVQLFAVVDGATFSAGEATTNASGVYSIGALSTGTYFAEAFPPVNAAFLGEVYDDILCPCSGGAAAGSGTGIAVTTGVPTTGITFRLTPAASISGQVRSSATGLPMQDVFLAAHGDRGGTMFAYGGALTDASGHYTIRGLPAGRFFVITSTTQAVDEVYDNAQCPGACVADDAPSLGHAVTTTSGATTSDIDFSLDPGGTITGVVHDALAMSPVSQSVFVFRVIGSTAVFAGGASSNGTGVYTVTGLATGTYVVLTRGSGYASELFGGLHCDQCQGQELLTGVHIAVTSGATTTNVNFSVDQLGTLSGAVFTNTGGTLIAGTFVGVLKDGASQAQRFFAASGTYSAAVPAGTYRVFTANDQFANKVYNGVACPGGSCSESFVAANGASITVGAGATVGGLDFALDALSAPPGPPLFPSATGTPGGIAFTWQPPTTGGVATSFLLEGGIAPGNTIVTLPTSATSLVVPGVPPGVYFVRIKGVNAFGTGVASTELRLVVGPGGSVGPDPPIFLTAWAAGARLNMTWFAPQTGSTPTDYILEAGSAPGLSNIAVIPVAARAFTFEPVPDGFYFLRVRSRIGGYISAPTADVMVNVGGVPAPPSRPRGLATSVAGNVVTLAWLPPIFVPVTSYVLEAGTAPGLSNAAVFNTGNSATTLVVPNVPPGTYFVRLRALNGQGSSPVSSERVVTVP